MEIILRSRNAKHYVRCINTDSLPDATLLTFGKYYQVIKIVMNIYYLKEDGGDIHGYFVRRFEYSIKYNRKNKLEMLNSL